MMQRTNLHGAERLFWVAAGIGYVVWAVCALAYFGALAAGIAAPDVARVGSSVIGLSATLCVIIAMILRVNRMLAELEKTLSELTPPALRDGARRPAPSWIPRVIVGEDEDESARQTRAAMRRASAAYAAQRDGRPA